MDFHNLLAIAAHNQLDVQRKQSATYRGQLKVAPAKKECKPRVRSDVIQKLLKQKEAEKELQKTKTDEFLKKQDVVIPKGGVKAHKPASDDNADTNDVICAQLKTSSTRVSRISAHPSQNIAANISASAERSKHTTLSHKKITSTSEPPAVSLKRSHSADRDKKSKHKHDKKHKHSSSASKLQNDRTSNVSTKDSNAIHIGSSRNTISSKTSNINDKPPVEEKKSDGIKKKISGKRKSVPNQPPAMSFEDLMKIAKQQKKQGVTMPTVAPKPKKEPEKRPMTQEEKDRHERTSSSEYKHWYKYGAKLGSNGKDVQHPKTAVKNSRESQEKVPPSHKQSASVKTQKSGNVDKSSMDNSRALCSSEGKHYKEHSRQNMPVSSHKASKNAIKQQTASSTSRQNSGRSGPQMEYTATNENILVCKKSSDASEPKDEPKMSTWDKYQQNKSKPTVKRQRIEDSESDSELDEDLEGFVDDGAVEDDSQNYSSYIRDIFGYDKRKFRNESYLDTANMESSFATQMKEEATSARLGLMEDLEDIRQEEQEMKQKMLTKKKMNRR